MAKSRHAVLTVGGIDAENGLTNYEVETASLARATMRQATSTTVLADSQKMGRTALAKVCDLVNVDRVVTDREPRPEIRRAMEATDVDRRRPRRLSIQEEIPRYFAISASVRSEFNPGWTEIRRCAASSSMRSADRLSGSP